MDLSERVAVVTGGASGICRAVAATMAHVELRRSWTEEKKIQGVLAERTIQHSNLKLDMKIIVTTLV
jgi:NAD(P)-dependent dehydrogenase (short-subunit alcohol dehydrogenase family)